MSANADRIELWFGNYNSKTVRGIEQSVIKSNEFFLLEKLHPDLFQCQSGFDSAVITRTYQLILNGKPRITKLVFTYDQRRNYASCSLSLESLKEMTREFARHNMAFDIGKEKVIEQPSRVAL